MSFYRGHVILLSFCTARAGSVPVTFQTTAFSGIVPSVNTRTLAPEEDGKLAAEAKVASAAVRQDSRTIHRGHIDWIYQRRKARAFLRRKEVIVLAEQGRRPGSNLKSILRATVVCF
jgi:hypothetical protein